MLLVLCMLSMAAMLFAPHVCRDAARSALVIWGLDVVPSLFPYMVMCRLSAKYLRQYRIFPPAAVSVLGLLGGSPSGAAVLGVYIRSGMIRKKEAYALMTLVGGVSPAFLLSTMSTWGFEIRICALLAGIQWLSALLASGAVYALTNDAALSVDACYPADWVDDHAIMQAVQGVMGVGGCLVIFSVAGEWISIILGRFCPDVVPTVIHAMLEMAGGICKLSALPLSSAVCFVIASAMIGFSGVSILLQNHMQLGQAGIKLSSLLACAALRGAAALVLALFAIPLLS